MRQILVPTDFSDQARWAAEAASDIATRAAAELVFLHVIEQPTPQSYSVQGEIDATEGIEERLYTLSLIEKSRDDVANWVSDFSASAPSVKSLLRVGNPYHGIAQTIVDHSVDLVVMGTTVRSTLEKLFIGSTTESVMKHSRCPVLTIHHKPSGEQLRNIVYATSLQHCETSFAEVIKGAQSVYGAKVHLVKVNTPGDFTPDHETLPLLRAFVERMGLSDYTLNIVNDKSPVDGILHFADSINADLIGMAAHDRSWFSELISRGTAGEVINQSTRPVLTFVTETTPAPC